MKTDTELLTKLVELLENQNEILNESNILKGEILHALDELKNGILNSYSKVHTNTTFVPNIDDSSTINPDLDYVDQEELSKAFGELLETEVQQISVFWPKNKKSTRRGWARVSIKHPNLKSLKKRISCGCLCGNQIVIKKLDNSDEFFTCANATSGCPYRPAAYLDQLTFLTNLPPGTHKQA